MVLISWKVAKKGHNVTEVCGQKSEGKVSQKAFRPEGGHLNSRRKGPRVIPLEYLNMWIFYSEKPSVNGSVYHCCLFFTDHRREQTKANQFSSRGDTLNVLKTSLSCVRLFATPQTVALQAPLSVGFFRQEYWSGLPFPSPEDLPNPGIEPSSPSLQADSLPSELQGRSNMYWTRLKLLWE